jgi:hypothetical protein
MSASFHGEGLIFIISQPRSGSTLLQRVLAGSPEVQTSAETWLMLHPLYWNKGREKIEAEYGSSWAREAVEEFLDNYTDGRDVYDDAIRAWAEVIYTNALQQNGKRYFLDKTPRYFFIIGDLYRLFPRAKFIFLLRNPMAVLASELNTYVKGDWPVLARFSPDLLDAPRWIADGIELLGDEAITVRYEDFVSDPEVHIADLCERLGIAFHKQMLDYSKTPRPVGRYNDPAGIAQHSTTTTASVDKWKRLADDDQSLLFARCYLQALGERTIGRFGYDYDEIHAALYGRKLREKNLYPWATAMQPRGEWSRQQHIASDYYFNRRQHGRFRGALLTAAKYLRIALRKLVTPLARRFHG